MNRLKIVLKRSGISLLALLVTTFYPVGTVAATDSTASTDEVTTSQTESTPADNSQPVDNQASQTQTDSTSNQQPAQPSQPESSSLSSESGDDSHCPRVRGTQRPTGSDGPTYTFNPETCLWENDYYTWDPVTKDKTKKTAYDWNYSPARRTWEKVVPPAPALVAGPQNQSLTVDPNNPNSLFDANLNNSSDISLNYDVAMINWLFTQAASGNVLAGGNTTLGNSSSGDALAAATIINLLQSNTSFTGGNLNTYSADIYGDVYGDLFIDPALLASLQPASSDLTVNNQLDVSVNESALIDNDITLDAQSGDVLVHDNTTAGDATSGNAGAILNLINLINSSITSGGSFLGMLNIYGNLDGDILLPPEVLNQVIANNSSTTNIDSSYIENTEILANLNNNQTISNNVTLNAQTGDVTASDNTTAGNLTSGNVSSNLTVLNLTGRQVVAANSLLVFVNVLGQWVGLIMDAPSGTTSAALGSNVSRNTAVNNNVNLEANSDQTINNRVNVNAASGDVGLNDNTTVGNGRSGDATASANVTNMLNSNFALSDWFGILFINVFGSWKGSFGVNTEAGNHLATGGGLSSGAAGQEDIKVFRFAPSSDNNGRFRLEKTNLDAEINPGAGDAILASAVTPGAPASPQTSSHVRQDTEVSANNTRPNYIIPTASVLIGAGILGAERFLSYRQRREYY